MAEENDHPTGEAASPDADRFDTARADDPDREPGVRTADEKRSSLPLGAGIRGDDDEIPGTAGWGTPSEDAPGEGRLAPDGDNPPP